MSPALLLALSAVPALQDAVPPHSRTCEQVIQAVGAHSGWQSGADAAPQLGGTLQPLPGWYSGDTHSHRQLCGAGVGQDLSVAELFAQQQAAGLDVACALLWHSPGGVSVQDFFSSYAPLVTGVEESVSMANPGQFLQHDIETSGFGGPSQFGHLIGLGLSDGHFDPAAKFSTPLMDFMRAQPGSATGYAHVIWPDNGTYPPIELIGPDLAYFAPIDLALGKLDFIERVPLGDDLMTWSFPGMHYPMLNSGLRVAITAGSDNTCIYPQPGDARTWVEVEGELDYYSWIEGIRAGRTTISQGGSEFLHFTTQNVGVGRQVDLATPGTLPMRATMFAAPGLPSSGTIEILRNGQVIASEDFDLPNGGVHSFLHTQSMERSAWLAARVKSRTHTGAVYVIVEDEPIVELTDALYWIGYCDHLSNSVANNQGTFLLEPADQAEILGRIAAAREVYVAYARAAGNSPQGTLRFGSSTQACQGPIAIGATVGAKVGDPNFAITCINAPGDTTGWLMFGTAGLPTGLAAFGITSYLDPLGGFFSIPAQTQGAGFASLPVSLPPAAASVTLIAQYVWLNTLDCAGTGALSASNALVINAY